MYALRYRDNDPTGHCTLVELTRAQIKLLGNEETMRDGGWCYQFCSTTYAHRWVCDGGHHETPLYLDHQRRIRR